MPWPIRTIGDVCEVVNGGTPKTGVARYWGGPHQWVTPAEMGERETPFIAETERSLTDAGISDSSACSVPPFSVILSSRAPIGHLVINEVPMAFNQGCKGLVPGAEMHFKFLYYWLFSQIDVLNALGTGATFKELSLGKLRTVPVPVPPLVEQRRIAALLDEAFEAIAKASANAERAGACAIEVFAAVRRQAFEDEGLAFQVLGGLCENLDSRRVPVTKRDRKPGEIPYYGASGIVDFVEGWLYDENLLLVSEDGANLLARTYPIAFSVSGKCWVNNHAHVLRFANQAHQSLVEHYLNSISLAPWVSGMAQPKLNQRALNSIPVPVASPDTCDCIVSKLDTMEAETHRAREVYGRKAKILAELRKSLLTKAFSGQLTNVPAIAA